MPANVGVVSSQGTQGAEMRIASYCRISTDEERQPFSLGAQRDRLDAYIASQDGWKLVRSYSDQTSGKTLHAPAYTEHWPTRKTAATTSCSCSRSTGLRARSLVLRRFLKDSTVAGCRSAPPRNHSIPRRPQAA